MDAPKRQLQAFLIKLATPGSPGSYAPVMGCSATLVAINYHPVAFENIGEALRSLIHTPATLTIAGQGTFEDADRRSRMEARAIAGSAEPVELYFDGGLRVQANMIVMGLDFAGHRYGEAVFDVMLESEGACHVC